MEFDWLIKIAAGLYACALVALSLRILLKRRSIGVTLSWLLFIYILPGMGILLYLLFGERYLGSLRAKRATQQFNQYATWLQSLRTLPGASTSTPSVIELVRHAVGIPSLAADSWQLFNRAESLFTALIDDIENARNVIFAEFYIIEVNGDVHRVVDALIAAAKRGVQVQLLFDSVGSYKFFRSDACKSMRAQGIQIIDALHANYFRMTLRRQDLRMHRKLLSIDGHIAYTGSMNLVDPRYFKTKSGIGPWIDIMVRMRGEISHFTQGTLVFDWEMETGKRLEQYLSWPEQTDHHKKQMQLLPSGPAIDDELLLQVLLSAIHSAKTRVVITTPYFVPDESLFQALKTTAKRGIEVTLLVPRHNDSRLAQLAGQSFYQELLQAGVTIMRFRSGLLHTKAVIIDDHLSLVGSVNLDMRSIWLNFESTLIVDDNEFNAEMMAIVNEYLLQSQPLSLTQWKSRSFIKRLAENITQLASPLL